MHLRIFVLTLVLAIPGCLLGECEAQTLTPCSIVNLIASPVAYQDKLVQVIGVATIRFESTAVFLSLDDADNGVRKNAIWLDIEKYEDVSSLDRRYVVVEGIFDGSAQGHPGLYSGTIKKLVRIDPWPQGRSGVRE